MGIFGDAVNAIGDGGEKLLNKGKKVVGSAIEHGAHIVGDGLDKVGLDGAADWVEDKGDSVADHLGAHVGEQQLGQSEEPEELLHGDPDKVRGVVSHLANFSLAFESGSEGLAHLDPDGWDGFGAEAFRAKFRTQPEKWTHAATACAEAGLALETYAETLTWARGQAKEAVRLWKQGVAKSTAASTTYNKSVDTYHDAVKTYNDKVDKGEDPGAKPVSPGKFVDPGESDRQAARDTLTAARQQRNSVAADAVPKVQAAMKLAPPKPEFTDRMKNDFGDVGRALPIAGEHFVGGVVRSVTDLEKFARGLNPYDPYNMTHPAQYVTHLNSTAAGLLDTAAHPERLPGMILGTGWGSDGSEAGGRLLGNILIAIATDGGSAAGKTAGESAAKNAAKDAAESAARNAARGAAEDPVKAAIERAAKNCVSDPIDIATGDMILAQTDITLPGTLPLVLERTHISSYRIGRFFGPSWASTLDQRLELDDQGVAFVADDGAILLYPVPEPGVPTLPAHGPRWPLEWDGHPGSPLRITRTEDGQTLHFTSVPGAPATPGGPTVLNLAEVGDRNGNTYAVTYNDEGIPTEVHHSGGYRLGLNARDGRVTALRLLDPSGREQEGRPIRSFRYDAAGNLSAVANSADQAYRFGYDGDGRITEWTDRNETTYRYVYDSRGRCVATRGPDGFLSSELAYDDATRTTVFTDSTGQARTYRHNSAFRLVAETDPTGQTAEQEWDASNRHVTRAVDPLGNTTAYAYDDNGDLIELTLPDGTTATAVHNELRRPLRTQEPGGATWTHTYDDRGNLLSTTDAMGAETRFTYSPRGHLTAVTDALGAVRRVTPDAAGLPVEETDELGCTTALRRDYRGRVVEVTDPLGQVMRMGWTDDDLPAWREGPDGSRESWTWDPEGNPLTHTDASGNVTRHTNTHFDLPAVRTLPDGSAYSFAYDTELRLAAVTNPRGRTWVYTYDPAGRLAAETDFDGRTIAYAYDPAGRLTSRTNGAGETLHFVRDALGQVTAVRTGEQVTATYEYDDAGAVIRAVNADAEVATEYDAAGRVLRETVNGRTTAYAYDALGRCVSRTTPSGRRSQWTYDAAGRPLGLRTLDGELAFAHDALGREVERRVVGGATLHQSWDRGGRLSTQRLTATAGAASTSRLLRAYGYRPDGHLAEIRDSGSLSRTFGLDARGRVTRVSGQDWTETYAYDSAGNIAHSAGPSPHSAGDREMDGSRIRRAGRTAYEHDAQGRLVRRTRRLLNGQKRSWTYEWDAEDRLVAATTPDGGRWRYAYDPLGRRVAKRRLTADGRTAVRVDFSWDGSRLAEQTEPGGRVTGWDYAPGTHRPLVQIDDALVARGDGRFHAVVTDIAGTPTELVTKDGEFAWRRRSTLWGEGVAAPQAGADTTHCPIRFPGQYEDPETGLHYNYFRYYDPESARYVSPDPLGLLPSPDPAGYTDNPHAWIDPLGLACTSAQAKWEQKADFTSQKSMSKKYDAHAKDFLQSPGPRNKANMSVFENAMRQHMTAPGTKIYRFMYRDQGPAIGFIDPATQKMVMLHPDGKFWSAWKLYDNQYSDIVSEGKMR